MKVIAVQAPRDHLLAPSITALVATSQAVTIVTVIHSHQTPLAATAAIEMTTHAARTASGQEIEHASHVLNTIGGKCLVIQVLLPVMMFENPGD